MEKTIILLNRPTRVQQELVRLSTNIGAAKDTFICVKKDNKFYILDGSNRLFYLHSRKIEIKLIFINHDEISKYVCVVSSCDSNLDFVVKKHKVKSFKKYLSGCEDFRPLPDYFKWYQWNTLELKNVQVSQVVDYEVYKGMVEDMPSLILDHWRECQKLLDDEVGLDFDYEVN